MLSRPRLQSDETMMLSIQLLLNCLQKSSFGLSSLPKSAAELSFGSSSIQKSCFGKLSCGRPMLRKSASEASSELSSHVSFFRNPSWRLTSCRTTSRLASPHRRLAKSLLHKLPLRPNIWVASMAPEPAAAGCTSTPHAPGRDCIGCQCTEASFGQDFGKTRG